MTREPLISVRRRPRSIRLSEDRKVKRLERIANRDAIRGFSDDDVIKCINAEMTYRQICDKFFADEKAIYEIAKRYDLKVSQAVTIWGHENRVDRLRAAWEAGVSTIKIGRDLGVTKSAVVGKVHRLGLPERETPIHARIPLTDEQKEEIKRLHADGRTIKSIHAEMKIAIKVISSVVMPPRQPGDNTKRNGRVTAPKVTLEMSRLPMPPRAIEMTLFQTVAYVAAPIVVVRAPPGPGKRCEWLDGDRPHFVQCTEPVTSFRDDGSYIDLAHQVWCCGHRRRVFRPRQVLEVAA